MSNATKIEWTNATWNPVRGCSIVSKGCTNCYAMRQAHRQSGKGGAYRGLTVLTKGGPVWTGEVRMVEDMLDYPSRLKRPHRIFVNSMSDLFHEAVSDEFIDRVFEAMALCQRHTFQILTKRPTRMRAYLASAEMTLRDAVKYEPIAETLVWPLPNIWLGISAEDQASFDDRWQHFCGPELHGWPLWLSAEPLLGPIDARAAMPNKLWQELESWRGGELKWVVAGGESGHGARPMHPDWARSLRDQCAVAGVPFFFKQWGAWLGPGQHGDPHHQPFIINSSDQPLHTTKKAAGRALDGHIHDEYPA